MNDLNEPTRRVLAFVEDYIEENGYAPTYMEIAEGIGRSKSTVHYHSKRLIARGYLEKKANSPRTLRLVR